MTKHLGLRNSVGRAVWTLSACVLAVVLTAGTQVGCAPSVPSVRSDVIIDTENVDVLLDRYTESQKDAGCAMRLLIDNEDTYEAFREVITSAESTLHIATLFFDDDRGLVADIALEFAELLAARAREGIEVRVILDGFTQDTLGRADIPQILADSGVEVIAFTPPISRSSLNYLFYHAHKKMLIADGRRAIIGGSNYGARYMMPDHWRDTDVLLDGPVVTTIQQEFLHDWESMGGSPVPSEQALPALGVAGELGIRSIEQRPAEHVFNINNAILVALRLAEHRVLIESPYFNPTDWLIDDLIAAAGRGVEIVLLTNGPTSMDVSAVYPVVSSWFPTLVDHGIRVFLWDTPGRTMHSKALVIDDKLAMVGSHNLNGRSILWDTENAVMLTDPSAVAEVHLMVETDLAEPHVFEIDRDWLAVNEVGSRGPLSVPVLLGVHF